MEARESYPITIAGIKRELPLFEVKPGLRIAILNILGDVELVEACAKELNRLLADTEFVILTPEAKSIPIAHVRQRKRQTLSSCEKNTSPTWAMTPRPCPSRPANPNAFSSTKDLN